MSYWKCYQANEGSALGFPGDLSSHSQVGSVVITPGLRTQRIWIGLRTADQPFQRGELRTRKRTDGGGKRGRTFLLLMPPATPTESCFRVFGRVFLHLVFIATPHTFGYPSRCHRRTHCSSNRLNEGTGRQHLITAECDESITVATCRFWLFLPGCSSSGALGLVTKRCADPASLLKSGLAFKELGPVQARVCRHVVLAIIPWGRLMLPVQSIRPW